MRVKCDVCGSMVEVPEASPAAAEVLEEKAEPQEASVPEMLTEVLLNSQELCSMVDGMLRDQIAVKDAQIDRLHKELQFYKDDQSARYVDQVMKAIIKVRKDLLKRIHSEQWPELSGEQLRREYSYILDDVTDLLEQQNIDPYHTEPLEPFQPSIHQVARMEATEDAALDKRVKCSVSEGYKKGEKVLIAERVVLYQFKG